jgi:sulfite reductase (NADPH) hemoprotein beta-component
MPDADKSELGWIMDGVPETLIGDFGLALGGAAGLELDRYDLHLGGNLEGTRIPRLHLENITEPQILAELDALIGRWASERNPDECFGDFVIRAGIIAPVIDSARDFYAA